MGTKSWLTILENLIKDGDTRTMTEKIASLEKNLKEAKEKFEALSKIGIDREILEIYLQYKTKMSRQKVKEMLRHTEEFFNKLVAEETAEKL